MLLVTVVLWALNLTVSRHILQSGMEPLSYGAVRYGLASLVFLGITLVAEGTLRILRADLPVAAVAAATLYLNQLAFVYALDTTTASTVALILGATPIFAALLGLLLRTETPTPRFWLGAIVSFGGVGLVALGAGEVEGGLAGIGLGLATAATWAGYSVAIAPLMRRYSPSRISALVLGVTWVPLTLTGVPQLAGQEWSLGWEVWLLLVFATLGPLVLTNVLWFRSLHRIGPARATLAANLQPFVAALVAVLLLSERIGPLQVGGGALIMGGILVARRGGPLRAPRSE
jgi:drug/metabolite transporter (DMT)-like permease